MLSINRGVLGSKPLLLLQHRFAREFFSSHLICTLPYSKRCGLYRLLVVLLHREDGNLPAHRDPTSMIALDRVDRELMLQPCGP